MNNAAEIRPAHATDRRTNHVQRELVILGNHLALWAGRKAVTQEERQELGALFTAWDSALARLRSEMHNVSL